MGATEGRQAGDKPTRPPVARGHVLVLTVHAFDVNHIVENVKLTCLLWVDFFLLHTCINAHCGRVSN
jgi:hypothetical protein